MAKPIFAFSVSLVLALTASLPAQARELSPAMQAYEDVTPLRDAHSNGSNFVGVGVQPDIEVAPTVVSVRKGRDPELEVAVKTLLKVMKR